MANFNSFSSQYISPLDVSQPENANVSVVRLHCSICKQDFSSNYSLKRHMANKHTSTKEDNADQDEESIKSETDSDSGDESSHYFISKQHSLKMLKRV